MNNEKKLELIADALDIEMSSITAETNLSDIEEWDSMTKLALIVIFDDECGKKLTGEMIRSFVTVSDIMRAMDLPCDEN